MTNRLNDLESHRYVRQLENTLASVEDKIERIKRSHREDITRKEKVWSDGIKKRDDYIRELEDKSKVKMYKQQITDACSKNAEYKKQIAELEMKLTMKGKVVCGCGSTIHEQNLERHNNSQKHRLWLEKKEKT